MLPGLQKSLSPFLNFFYYYYQDKMSTMPTGGKILNTSKII